MASANDILLDNGYEGVVIFDNPSWDSAPIGVSHDGRAVYDYDKMIDWYMDTEDADWSEAAEMADDAVRACSYVDNSPIVMYGLEVF